MPYDIVSGHPDCADSDKGDVAVVKVTDGKVMGCHPDIDSAIRQIVALLIAEYGDGENSSSDISDRSAFACAQTGLEMDTGVEPDETVQNTTDRQKPDSTDIQQTLVFAEDSQPQIEETEETAPDTGEQSDRTVGEQAETEPVDIEWEALLAIEGVPTGDGRMIAEGALTWRDLPLPLMLQTENPPFGGHAGAVPCGAIREIERDGSSIYIRGSFYSGESGDMARSLIAEQIVIGISADIDMAKVVFVDPTSGGEIEEIDSISPDMFDRMVECIVEGRVMGATITPFPAFAETRIWLLDDVKQAVAASASHDIWRVAASATATLTNKPRTVVASAAAVESKTDRYGVPYKPPAEWFTLQPMPEPQPFTVHPNGRIYGLVAKWGSCHIGYSGKCVTVPRNQDFRYFYGGRTIETAEGLAVPCGPVVMDTVHPDLRKSASDAQAFYAQTGCQVAHVALYTNEHGIVAAGAAMPELDELTRRKFMAADLSPDWRTVDGQLTIVALLAVNTSGFMVPALAASAGSYPETLVARGLVDSRGEVVALVAAGAISKPSRVAASFEITIAELLSRIDQLQAAVSALEKRVSQLKATQLLRKMGVDM